MLDKLIINAVIIDGSGAPRQNGCVGIQNGKLVMNPAETNAAEVIDAAGRVVCPGFIDAHSHGDRLIGTEDGRLFKTPQGITTEFCGNCGSSYAPIPEDMQELLLKASGSVYPSEIVKEWTTFDRFLSFVETRPLSANARFYMGHCQLRLAVMGYDNRPATPAEMDRMKGLLREAMQAGAAGMSTGLIYVPGCYSTPEEIVELAKVVAEFDGFYASHIRNESDAVVESVEEVLNVGRKAGVRTCISHHKVQGKKNWGKQNITLEMIDKANRDGYHTTCDLYPYPRSMNVMRSCIPPWHYSNGIPAFIEKLKNKEYRDQLRAEMSDYDTPYDNFYLSSGGWNGVYIAAADATPDAPGLFMSDYAASLGKDPFDTYFDLLIENQGNVSGVYCTMSEDDMCQIVQSPYCVIGTDGCTPSWKHKGHPRASAAFPHAIDYFVKEKKLFTLEEMIYKMTGLTADRLELPNKGLLKDGYDADLLILDYDNLHVNATYDDPNRKTDGIDAVFVGGECVYRDLEFTGTYSGKVIRRR